MTRNKSLGLVLTALVLAAVLVSATAHAQTPAGTTIRNQASATFEDLLGNTFMATSNEVTTIVLPVFGVSVIPDDGGGSPPAPPAMSQTAIPGQTVYFSYTLTNTGNEVDSYDIEPLIEGSTTMVLGLGGVTIYHDVNGNGVLDGGEPVIVTGPGPGTLGPMNMGDTEFLLVSYQVPPTAIAGEEAYVGLRATSTNDAAQLDERNYSLTTVVSDAVMTAVMSGLPANVDPGNPITYQITGANVGNDDAHGVTVASVGLTGILIYDVLPVDPSTGLPLALAGAPAGAPGGGSPLYLPVGSPMAGSPETWGWLAAPAAGDIAVAYITNGDITIGQNYSLTYDVDVPLGMPAGIINNSGALVYIDNNPGTPDPTIVNTNNTQVNVNGIADVIVGPNGNPGAGTPPAYNDDVQVIPLAYASSTVDFINTARNDGNFPDEINIVLDGASTIPPAWTVQFFRIDGVTPLNDSGGDMIPDVGTLNPGETRDFIVRITIPGTELGGAGPYNAVVQAVSAFNPAETNLTTDEITNVNPAAVDIGNWDGVPGTNNATVNQFANPGVNVDWPLDVINSGGSMDNFALSATLPPAWTVVFYEDANANGVLDLPELTPIASVGPLAAGGEVSVIARVAVPVGEIPGVFNNTFRATSGNNPALFDEILDTVTINTASAVTIVPDRNGTATSGGTIRYTHTVTNMGNVSDTFLLSALSSNGWSYTFFDLLNNPIVSVTLNPGVFEDIVVQISIPGGQPVGTMETGTITVTGNGFGATNNAIDVTTIVAGNLVLAKVVNPPGNQAPGVELTYRTDYSNVGTADILNIVIYDAVPAWTQYRVGSAAQGTLAPGILAITAEFSDDGGGTWGYGPVSGGGGAPVNFDANVTNVRWLLTGTLAGGDGTVDGVAFIVRIIAE